MGEANVSQGYLLGAAGLGVTVSALFVDHEFVKTDNLRKWQ